VLAASVHIEHLADHPETIPTLVTWLEGEWPSWYGPEARVNARVDLVSYSDRSTLPVGLVAFLNGELCGFAALKTDAITGCENLGPWAGVAFVLPGLRGKGIGSKLVQALEEEARVLGYKSIYAGTSGAMNLLRRCGWRERGKFPHKGEEVYVYETGL